MQKQPTKRPRTAAKDYVPVVQQACDKVKGFLELYNELKRSVSINGKSQSALINYSRQLAHLALHYNCMPLDLDPDQVMDYLYQIKSDGTGSASFFNFTVHGMRYACKMRGLEYTQFSLPTLKGPRKLPVVLNGPEVKALLRSCKLLRHRLIIGLCYGCGLRSSEVQHLQPSHADLERGMLHIHQGKGSKDRCVPLGKLLCRGISQYLVEEVPGKYLFESKSGEVMTDGYFGDVDPCFGDIDHPLQVKIQRTRSTDNITVFFLNFHNLKIQFCKRYAPACLISRQPR